MIPCDNRNHGFLMGRCVVAPHVLRVFRATLFKPSPQEDVFPGLDEHDGEKIGSH